MHHSEKIDWSRIIALPTILFTIGGVLCVAFSLKAFLLPNNFIDGGVTGLSILISKKMHIPIGIPLLLFNLPFVYIGYKKIGKSFAIQTLISVVMLSIVMHTIPMDFITTREPT